MKRAFSMVIMLLIIVSCHNSKKQVKLEAPLFDNLGQHHLEITTNEALTQRLFDQGLNLSYGFNHAEAARAFREAARLDPECAMAYWGIALVLGPNLNAPMDPSDMGEVYMAVQNALAKKQNATEWEQAMIDAIAIRYPDSITTDRAQFDIDYAAAMGKVYKRFPDNSDIATLYAEALMDVHPWDLYTYDGEPKEWTPQIVSLFETILERWPEHPGANHFNIHAIEASNNPEKAMASADVLRELVPGAGHLVHMPSHIYIRTGRYHEGSIANEKAMIADSIYISTCQTQGLYPLLYYPHNIHFLAATAALEGRGDRSISASWQLSKRVDTELMKDPEWATLQHFFSIPYFVMVKFGQWNRILELPELVDVPPYPKAIEHYARGMAYLKQGKVTKAEESLAGIREIMGDESLQDLTIFGLNLITDVLEIANHVLTAEIAANKGNYDVAVEHFQTAINIEDHLIYNEPPDWFFSVRHHLGATLLEMDKYEEAETIFRQDLAKYPENGWALNGLMNSLENQDKKEEASEAKKRFDKAWQWANVELSGSLVAQNSYDVYDDQDLFKSSLAFHQVKALPNCGVKQ
ncbi:tetratricopeptide repeat protein [Fulvivirgaceae bacterium BMA12]|uniref:Tetratricopeptide repeat protein n=1 Tax=Agaribacillus aureus TaxID=3051825 RepID=A0ABT8L945_9BACT|nr:tetratricopeptide repeat protein [Fulvivirgaceae bacterium BMA12]